MNKKDFDSVEYDADFLNDVSLEKLKKDKTTNDKLKINASLMTDVEAVTYEGQGIAEDNSYQNGNDDTVNTDFLDNFVEEQDEDITEDDKELQDKLSKELDEKIKSQSAEKTLYAPSNDNFMGSIYEEADQASEDFVNDLISTMPTSEEYNNQFHEYENDDEYVERADTINHTNRTEKVSLIASLSMMFSNFVNFKGYASKSEYWFGVLWIIIFNVIAGATNIIGVGWIVSAAVSLIFVIPYSSLTCRRFNDVGLSSTSTMFATLMQGLGVISLNIVNVYYNVKLLTAYNGIDLSQYNINLMLILILLAIASLFVIILLVMSVIFVSSKENAYKNKTMQMTFYTVFSGGFMVMTVASSVLMLLLMLGII